MRLPAPPPMFLIGVAALLLLWMLGIVAAMLFR